MSTTVTSQITITLINTKLTDLLNTAFPGSVKAIHITNTPEDFTVKISSSHTLHKFLVYLKDHSLKSYNSQFLSRISAIPTKIEGNNVAYYVLVPTETASDFFIQAQLACISHPNCFFHPTTSIINFIKDITTKSTEIEDYNNISVGTSPPTEIGEDKAFSMCVNAFMALDDIQLERSEAEKMLRDYGSLADIVDAGYVSYLREGISPDKAKYLNDLFRK